MGGLLKLLYGKDGDWKTKMCRELKILHGIFITKAVFMMNGFAFALYLLGEYEATNRVKNTKLRGYLASFTMFGLLGMCLGITAVVMNEKNRRKPLEYIAILLGFHMVGEVILAVTAASSELSQHSIVWSAFLFTVFGTIAVSNLITIVMITLTVVWVIPETGNKKVEALTLPTKCFSTPLSVRLSIAVLKSMSIAAFLAHSPFSPPVFSFPYIGFYCLGVISASFTILGVINNILGGLGTSFSLTSSLLLLLVVEVGVAASTASKMMYAFALFTGIDIFTHYKGYMFLKLTQVKKHTKTLTLEKAD